MRTSLCAGTCTSLLLFAAVASAQEGLGSSGPSPEALVAIQGKFTSVYGDDGAAVTPLPAFPATVVLASVLTPAKFKSKKRFLLIDTTMNYECDADAAASVVTVAGAPVQPDPVGGIDYFVECNDADGDTEGFQTRSRHWFTIREIDGGPVIPEGASVVVQATSAFGTAVAGSLRAILVEVTK